MKITKEDLEKSIHIVDLIQHPYILLVNPTEENRIRQALKDTEFEDTVLIQPYDAVEEGKAIMIDRKKLEDSALTTVNYDFGKDITCANNSFGCTWSELE
jgi:hypothetical protein